MINNINKINKFFSEKINKLFFKKQLINILDEDFKNLNEKKIYDYNIDIQKNIYKHLNYTNELINNLDITIYEKLKKYQNEIITYEELFFTKIEDGKKMKEQEKNNKKYFINKYNYSNKSKNIINYQYNFFKKDLINKIIKTIKITYYLKSNKNIIDSIINNINKEIEYNSNKNKLLNVKIINFHIYKNKLVLILVNTQNNKIFYKDIKDINNTNFQNDSMINNFYKLHENYTNIKKLVNQNQ